MDSPLPSVSILVRSAAGAKGRSRVEPLSLPFSGLPPMSLAVSPCFWQWTGLTLQTRITTSCHRVSSRSWKGVKRD